MEAHKLTEVAKQLQHLILTSTTQAGSGHPTSSLSAVHIMASIMFGGSFTYDIERPENLYNDEIIFSKGHASPLLYALWATAGAIPFEELGTLRKAGSRLEGHPTRAFPFHRFATGSLGQGLSLGLGVALGKELLYKQGALEHADQKTYVLLGDSECAEGQVWEAAMLAGHYKTKNLIAIVDVNGLGQRGATLYGHSTQQFAGLFAASGWKTLRIDDGNSLKAAQQALSVIEEPREQPLVILANTKKGSGISFLENADGWHGKALNSEQLEKALVEIGHTGDLVQLPITKPDLFYYIDRYKDVHISGKGFFDSLEYGKIYSTRELSGKALQAFGTQLPTLVVLDAETNNSTFTRYFKDSFPDRFLEMYIAEQNMISVGFGLSSLGLLPVCSSFGAFLERGFEQLRMGNYSHYPLILAGSHVGVSIGEDGLSQMALEDMGLIQSLPGSKAFYPTTASEVFTAYEEAFFHTGISYLRFTRSSVEIEEIGEEHSSYTAYISGKRPTVLLISAGATIQSCLAAQKILLNEGIEIVTLSLNTIHPFPLTDVVAFCKKYDTLSALFIVEDHYPFGGIYTAYIQAHNQNTYALPPLHHLAVYKEPHSGSPEDNLDIQDLSSRGIINAILAVYSLNK